MHPGFGYATVPPLIGWIAWLMQLFGKITIVGSIKNPDAREYGTTVYLYEDRVMSFNDFRNERISEFRQDN